MQVFGVIFVIMNKNELLENLRPRAAKLWKRWQGLVSPLLAKELRQREKEAVEAVELAHIDTKMGIPNFRAYLRYCAAVIGFQEKLPEENKLEGLSEKNQLKDRAYLLVSLLDIDKFKEINDLFIHDDADKVLEEIGRRLQNTLRWDADWGLSNRGKMATALKSHLVQQGINYYDTAFRHGGEEIGIISPVCYDEPTSHQAAYDDAQRIAQRIQDIFSEPFTIPVNAEHVERARKYIAQEKSYYKNARIIEREGEFSVILSVTASIGYITATLDEFRQSNVLGNADALTNHCKDNGRNLMATRVPDMGGRLNIVTFAGRDLVPT